jgi:hypothetical protein
LLSGILAGHKQAFYQRTFLRTDHQQRGSAVILPIVEIIASPVFDCAQTDGRQNPYCPF